MDTCTSAAAASAVADTTYIDVSKTVAALQELVEDTSPLRRALRAHFASYGGLLESRDRLQGDDL